jgi:hypothetical protein
MHRSSTGKAGVRRVVTGALTVAVLISTMGTATAFAAQAAPMSATTVSATTPADAPLQESTTEDKVRAAAVLGIVAPPSMTILNDKNFVLALWRKAKEGSEVKNAALLAFTDDDAGACTRFILTGIFAADQIDGENEIRDAVAKEKARTAKRNAVAQVPGMQATDEVINLSDKEFVLRVWQVAADGSAVKTAAAAALRPESTPEDYQKFINKDIYDARQVDVQKELADAAEADRKAKELKASQDAKALAVSAALGIVADDNMKNLPDRDFVAMIWQKTDGAEIKIAARTALDNGTADVLKAFIFTGVHDAHQRDIAARDAKDLALKTQQTKDVLDAAQRDGFQPNLVAAAKEALKTPTLAVLTAFLAKGQHDAAKLDFAKPVPGLVMELKGLQSGRCVQVAGLGADATNNGSGTELWDCVRGDKQRWILRDRGTDTFALQNVNSGKCLAVQNGGVSDGDSLVQYDCAANTAEQSWQFVPVGDDGMIELRNVKSGKVATAADGGTPNATLVLQYTDTHSSNQGWRVIDVNHTGEAMAPGTIELKGLQSGRCIQVGGVDEDAQAEDRPTELWDCLNGVKQLWDVVDRGDHQYALKNVNSGKCLDVNGGSAAEGVSLIQHSCHFDANQLWVFVPGKAGSVKLQSVLTGGVATAAQSASNNGALIEQFSDANGDEQQWSVITTS